VDNGEDNELRCPRKRRILAIDNFEKHGFERKNCPIHVWSQVIPGRYHEGLRRERRSARLGALRDVTTEGGRGILLTERPTHPQSVHRKRASVYRQQGKPIASAKKRNFAYVILQRALQERAPRPDPDWRRLLDC
jgi:hypothetical protein